MSNELDSTNEFDPSEFERITVPTCDSNVECDHTVVTVVIDWNNLKYTFSVGKRNDCKKMIFTEDEHNIYGKNRTLKNGEIAYLCRLYHAKGCKSRLYMDKNGRLYKKGDFIPHNHPPQENEHQEFKIESSIKDECGNLAVLVNSRTQSSAVTEIFDKHMKL